VIHIGRAAEAHDPLFSRVLHLVKTPPKPASTRGRASDTSNAAAADEAGGART
jgi:hypothetical protein